MTDTTSYFEMIRLAVSELGYVLPCIISFDDTSYFIMRDEDESITEIDSNKYKSVLSDVMSGVEPRTLFVHIRKNDLTMFIVKMGMRGSGLKRMFTFELKGSHLLYKLKSIKIMS